MLLDTLRASAGQDKEAGEKRWEEERARVDGRLEHRAQLQAEAVRAGLAAQKDRLDAALAEMALSRQRPRQP